MSIDCMMVMLLTQLGPLFLGHMRIWLRLGFGSFTKEHDHTYIQDEHSFISHF